MRFYNFRAMIAGFSNPGDFTNPRFEQGNATVKVFVNDEDVRTLKTVRVMRMRHVPNEALLARIQAGYAATL